LGCIASKKCYFYELKIHLMVAKDGQPIQRSVISGSYSDVHVLKTLRFDLPEGILFISWSAFTLQRAFAWEMARRQWKRLAHRLVHKRLEISKAN
jgi:hypothetical protein